jgi:hypothetical protein
MCLPAGMLLLGPSFWRRLEGELHKWLTWVNCSALLLGNHACPTLPYPALGGYSPLLLASQYAGGIDCPYSRCRRITTADGAAWSPFDRSLLATNDALYNQVGGWGRDKRRESGGALHAMPGK